MSNHYEFLCGISFDENPFEDEEPDDIHFYDLSGNEVTPVETE